MPDNKKDNIPNPRDLTPGQNDPTTNHEKSQKKPDDSQGLAKKESAKSGLENESKSPKSGLNKGLSMAQKASSIANDPKEAGKDMARKAVGKAAMAATGGVPGTDKAVEFALKHWKPILATILMPNIILIFAFIVIISVIKTPENWMELAKGFGLDVASNIKYSLFGGNSSAFNPLSYTDPKYASSGLIFLDEYKNQYQDLLTNSDTVVGKLQNLDYCNIVNTLPKDSPRFRIILERENGKCYISSILDTKTNLRLNARSNIDPITLQQMNQDIESQLPIQSTLNKNPALGRILSYKARAQLTFFEPYNSSVKSREKAVYKVSNNLEGSEKELSGYSDNNTPEKIYNLLGKVENSSRVFKLIKDSTAQMLSLQKSGFNPEKLDSFISSDTKSVTTERAMFCSYMLILFGNNAIDKDAALLDDDQQLIRMLIDYRANAARRQGLKRNTTTNTFDKYLDQINTKELYFDISRLDDFTLSRTQSLLTTGKAYGFATDVDQLVNTILGVSVSNKLDSSGEEIDRSGIAGILNAKNVDDNTTLKYVQEFCDDNNGASKDDAEQNQKYLDYKNTMSEDLKSRLGFVNDSISTKQLSEKLVKALGGVSINGINNGLRQANEYLFVDSAILDSDLGVVAGGRRIPESEVKQHHKRVALGIDQEFKKRGIAWRIFNINNPRSLAYNVATKAYDQPIESTKTMLANLNPIQAYANLSHFINYYVLGNVDTAYAETTNYIDPYLSDVPVIGATKDDTDSLTPSFIAKMDRMYLEVQSGNSPNTANWKRFDDCTNPTKATLYYDENKNPHSWLSDMALRDLTEVEWNCRDYFTGYKVDNPEEKVSTEEAQFITDYQRYKLARSLVVYALEPLNNKSYLTWHQDLPSLTNGLTPTTPTGTGNINTTSSSGPLNFKCSSSYTPPTYGLKSNTINLANLVAKAFCPEEIGGYRPTGQAGVGKDYHTTGEALDVHFSADNNDQKTRGDALFNWCLSSGQNFGITQCIWNDQIFTTSRAGEGIRPYQVPAGNEINNTTRHRDHVHITIPDRGAENSTDLEFQTELNRLIGG